MQSTYEFLILKCLYEIDFDLTQFVSRTISFSRNLHLFLQDTKLKYKKISTLQVYFQGFKKANQTKNIFLKSN